MPFYAANGVAIDKTWEGDSTFPPGGGHFPYRFTKLDAWVDGTDAVFQVKEQPGGWFEDATLEGLLRMGFNSIPFETPFIAIRFRVYTNTLLTPTGELDVKLFG